MTIGDTLQVQITATWGTVGAGFRPMALIGSSKQVVVASAYAQGRRLKKFEIRNSNEELRAQGQVKFE